VSFLPQSIDLSPTAREKLTWQIAEDFGVEVWVQRDDLVHPLVSGNKWRKLYDILQYPPRLQETGWSSAGGVWSNHLLAMSAVAAAYDIPTRFFIRGMETETVFISRFISLGIECIPVDRTTFRNFHSIAFCPENALGTWIPEGGGGIKGVCNIENSLRQSPLPEDFHCVYIACGTGTTLAGFYNAWKHTTKVVGVSALRISPEVWPDILRELLQDVPLVVVPEQQPGFGKLLPEYVKWIGDFYRETACLPDPVYTWRVFHFLEKEMRAGRLRDQRILVIHTGGLQSWQGKSVLWKQHLSIPLPDEVYCF
jgi:1-aminocyclopropane-1-carboxylate deaminase